MDIFMNVLATTQVVVNENEKEISTEEVVEKTFTISDTIYNCELDFSKSLNGEVNMVRITPIEAKNEDDFLRSIYADLDLTKEKKLKIYTIKDNSETILLNPTLINVVRYNAAFENGTYDYANLTLNLRLS